MKRLNKNAKLIIDKKSTTSDFTDYITSNTDYTYDETLSSMTADVQYGEKQRFQSIVSANYKKPSSGTVQDNMTRNDIKQKLEGYIPLRTMNEKKLLTKLPHFKTWIKYINEDTRQFRTGGLLMKVEYPDYIMLVNTSNNLTWSVQLKNNIIFIRDPRLQVQEKKAILKEKEKVQEVTKEEIKDKLYELYKMGKLRANK
jgi:hypothetical protein